MRLVDDWHRILVRAWSVRFMALAAVLTGAEFALPYFLGWRPLHPLVASFVTFVVVTAAFVARFIAQPSIRPED